MANCHENGYYRLLHQNDERSGYFLDEIFPVDKKNAAKRLQIRNLNAQIILSRRITFFRMWYEFSCHRGVESKISKKMGLD